MQFAEVNKAWLC